MIRVMHRYQCTQLLLPKVASALIEETSGIEKHLRSMRWAEIWRLYQFPTKVAGASRVHRITISTCLSFHQMTSSLQGLISNLRLYLSLSRHWSIQTPASRNASRIFKPICKLPSCRSNFLEIREFSSRRNRKGRPSHPNMACILTRKCLIHRKQAKTSTLNTRSRRQLKGNEKQRRS